MEACRSCFQSRFPSLLNVEAFPWGRSNGFGPPCLLWQKGISQTRRGSYRTDGRQDIAEEKAGCTPTAHDSSTWYVPEIQGNDGYERDRRGRERKKSLLAQVQGGRFISVIRLNVSAWGEMQKAPGPPFPERESRVKRSSTFPLPVHTTCLSLTPGWSCPELPLELGLQRTAVAWWSCIM